MLHHSNFFSGARNISAEICVFHGAQNILHAQIVCAHTDAVSRHFLTRQRPSSFESRCLFNNHFEAGQRCVRFHPALERLLPPTETQRGPCAAGYWQSILYYPFKKSMAGIWFGQLGTLHQMRTPSKLKCATVFCFWETFHTLSRSIVIFLLDFICIR